ncbi:MAG: hypothetical protein IRZ26_07965 [Clostridia bacterium]|nr:hypothetical protein [Clostridia bacterium]
MRETTAPEPEDELDWLPAFAAALRERQARLRAEPELPSREELAEAEARLRMVGEMARRLFGRW